MKGLTNRSSQPVAAVMSTFDFMKQFSMFATRVLRAQKRQVRKAVMDAIASFPTWKPTEFPANLCFSATLAATAAV
jgi:hypothetical protein